jgi:hypothetical protein
MRQLFITLILILSSFSLFAQEDLMNLLNQDSVPQINYTTATFKSTRIMNGHSIERMPPGQLDFRISHRFSSVNTGAYNLWGLDLANIHFSLEYGIFNWLMIGVGRGAYEKTFDGFTKFSILRQSSGAKEMPVSLSVFTSAALKTINYANPANTSYLTSRLAYTAQVLVARKFSPAFSFQITPTYIHRNLVRTASWSDPNDLLAFGAGGRLKITKRISLNGEYYLLANSNRTYMGQAVYNPLSVGIDIETGGHVFQIILTNSLPMIEKGFIGETTGQWSKGDIHIGFNISRVFTLKKPHQKPKIQ